MITFSLPSGLDLKTSNCALPAHINLYPGVEWLLQSPALREPSVTVECSPSVPPNTVVTSWTWLWSTWKVVSATEALISHFIYLNLNSHMWVVATGLCWPVQLPVKEKASVFTVGFSQTSKFWLNSLYHHHFGAQLQPEETYLITGRLNSKKTAGKESALCQLHRANGR